MQLSTRCQALKAELAQLKSALLPNEFDPLGQYSVDVLIRTRSFVVLAHAELEAFLEEICQASAETALREWKTSKSMSACLLYLTAYVACDVEKKWGEFGDKADTALGLYKKKIKANNGIKIDNQRTLLLPVGIDLAEISVLSAELDSFGLDRGGFAHTSATAQTTSVLDPRLKHDTVFKKILPEIEKLDELLHLRCSVNGGAPVKPNLLTRLRRLFRSATASRAV